MKRYYEKWRLKSNIDKTKVIIFHLDNKSADRQLIVFIDGVEVKYNFAPKYLGSFTDVQTEFR